jgi:glycogen debranching enzyme
LKALIDNSPGLAALILLLHFSPVAVGTQSQPMVAKFVLEQSGLRLQRHSETGAFFDVVGHRAAAFGYENRSLEAWVYPLKIVDDFNLGFRLEGYPLDISGKDILSYVDARPEATIFTYSHAAFTVKQIVFAPIDEPGIAMLLDVQTTLPITITGSFRPRLRLMWPAGLMTGNIGWDERQHLYLIGEETRRFVGLVGSPLAQDVSLMPYQEEPRDVPVQFTIHPTPDQLKSNYIPIVIAASIEGREKAKNTYDRILSSVQSLYQQNVRYYKRLQTETTRIVTPDERLNTAFNWAKVGVDKGFAVNPQLGTGLLAGYRTSGESERPGFAWFFGRDALWTSLAINSYGDYAAVRTALDFLKTYQRADGKIPHEISQSAGLIPWFTDYPYAWASADATPLYIIAHGDYYRVSGDIDFIKGNWDSILKAYKFTSASDTDRNGLIENTNYGHGWVEGGALYPAHEEIYMQGLWVEALTCLAEMADALHDVKLASEARSASERTRAATEATYWLAGSGYYAFATKLPQPRAREAEPGPERERRQSRLNELKDARLVNEDTVLPAVPLWWRVLNDDRAQAEIDHIGGGAIATDWGARILSRQSRLYDPLSYHYGSVWPLFTGWAAMGAYRYGRPHVGYQALMANALLTEEDALGYVTELLSGDFNSAFGRSSHHQIWSEAMVVAPVIRGLLGIEISEAGRRLTFSPRLPADWDRASAHNVSAGDARYDLSIEKSPGKTTVRVERRIQVNAATAAKIIVAPALPLDARIRSVTVSGRAARAALKTIGDVQVAEVSLDGDATSSEVVFNYEEGTDVYVERRAPLPGDSNHGLRILRSRASASTLHLSLEGLGGHSYELRVRTPHKLGETAGVKVAEAAGGDAKLTVTFEGAADTYVRRELDLPLLPKK